MHGLKLLKENGLLAKYKIDERVIPARKQRRAVVRYLDLIDRRVNVGALQKKALNQLNRSYSNCHWFQKLARNMSFIAVLSLLQGQFAHADELLESSTNRQLSAQTRYYIPAQTAADFTATKSTPTAEQSSRSLQSLHLLANQNTSERYQQTLTSLTDDEFFIADNAILTVIDPTLDQWELLADAVQTGEVLLLNADQPPLAQIIAKVRTMGQVQVLNILSHGADGEIHLAGQHISAGNLAEHEHQLKELGALLTEDGQLQLFGCDVAKSELGKNFVTELAQITGADVAGSVNLTGSGIEQTRQPSDWDLEYFTGEQTIGVAQTFNSKRLLAYNNVLATVYTFDDIPAQPHGYMCYGYDECEATVSDLTVRAVSSNPIHAVSLYGDYMVSPLPGQEQGVVYAGANNGGLWLMGGGVQNSGVPRSLEVSKTNASDFTPNSVKVRIWTYRSVNSTSSPDATFFEIVGLNDSNVQVASIRYESVYDDDTIDINFSNPSSSVYTRNNGGYFTGAPTLTQSGSFASVRKLQFKIGPYQFGIDDLSIGAAAVNTAPVNSVAPAVTGTATVGNALSGSAGTWTDADNDPLTYTRQWYRADDASGTNRVAISSATATTYTLTTSDAHKYIQVVVTANDGNGGTTPANSAYTAITNSAPVNSAVPSISGTATVGNALSTTNGTWSDADGDGRTFSYQWYRADDNSGTNAAVIGGATNSSYTLTTSDAHKFLSVVVTANDGRGSTTPASSAYTQVTNSAPVNSVAPSISGTATIGNALSTTNGTWSDADGDGRTFSYQWYRADDNSGTSAAAIGGATNSSYTLTTSDAHKFLRVVVTANDGRGGAQNAASAYTAVVNTAPTDIALSSNTVNQSSGSNAQVGNLTSTDTDGDTTFTYMLVPGDGDTHNASFNISEAFLRATDATALAAGDYSVRISTTDSASGSFERAFTVTVVDDVPPTAGISSSKVSLNASETATLTFTLDEASSDFAADDVTVTGGTLSDFDGSGTSYTALFTPADDSTTTATIDVAAARFTDAADNANTAATQLTIAVDTVVPDAPSTPVLSAGSDSGVSDADNITNMTTPTFTGTAEADSTVTLYDTDGIAVLGTETATGGHWSITSSALTEGEHELIASATDAAGNVSVASAPLTITIDTTAPAVSNIVPAADARAGDTSVEFTVTFPETVYALDSVGAFSVSTVAGDASGTVTAVSAASGSSVQVTISNITGTGTLQVNTSGTGITDVAGNVVAAFTAGSDHTVDTDAPAISGISFGATEVNAANMSDVSITLAGADAGSTYEYTITSTGGGTPVTGTGTVADTNELISGIDVSSLGDGTLTVSVTLTDDVSNVSTPVTDTVIKDTGEPTVVANGVSISDGNFRESEIVIISITLSEDVIITGGNNITLAINLGGLTRSAGFVGAVGSVLTFSYTVQAGDNTDESGVQISAGLDSVTLNGATVRDAVGNDADFSFAALNNAEAQVDTAAPDTPTIPMLASGDDSGVLDDDNITNVAQAVFSGTAEANSTITLGSDVEGAIGTIAVDGNGQWSLTPSAPLSDGTHQISAIATDAAGNASTASTALELVIDTVIPTLTTASFDQVDVDGTNYQSLSITLSGAEVDATANYSLTSSGGGTAVTGSVAVSAANQQLTGIDVSSLPDGTLTVSVTLTDTAGNVSSAVTDSISKDVNPVLTLPVNPPVMVDGAEQAMAGVIVSDTASTDISVVLSVGAGEGMLSVTGSGAVIVSGSGSETLTLTGTLTDINATLDTLSYQAPVNFTAQGLDAVSVLVELDDGVGVDSGVITIEVQDRPDIIDISGSVSWLIGSNTTVLLDTGSNASVTDLDSVDFNNGQLSVSITEGAQATQDLLTLNTDAEVTLDPDTALAGSAVQVDDGGGDIIIGTLVHDISEGHDLVINLNANATPTRVALVLQALAYRSTAVNTTAGTRTVSIALYDGSHVDAIGTTTVAVSVQQAPVDGGNGTVINNDQSGVNVTGTVTVTPNGVLNGGKVTGTINNSGVIRGEVTLGSNSVINGGTVSGNIIGNAAQPARINDATITDGASLSNVVIGADTVLQPGVQLGENVRFESETSIPAGLDLSGALRALNWSTGDARGVVMLDGDILLPGSGGSDDDMTIIRAIQLLGDYEPSGNEVEQDDSNGEILVVTSDFKAAVLPVNVTMAGPDDQPGTYIDENGDIVFVSVNRRVVLSYPVLASKPGFLTMLAGAGLQLGYDERANMQITNESTANLMGNREVLAVTREGGEYYYSARPDVLSLPAHRRQSVGLVEFVMPGLGSPTGLSIVYEDNGELREQDLVPVSPDWFGLKDTLLAIPGISKVSIDTQGILSVTVDGQVVRGRLEYVVFVGREAARDDVLMRAVGDKTGNGTTDYEIVYTNGDVQYLYVF